MLDFLLPVDQQGELHLYAVDRHLLQEEELQTILYSATLSQKFQLKHLLSHLTPDLEGAWVSGVEEVADWSNGRAVRREDIVEDSQAQ